MSALDLDALERENAPEPFTVTLGGRTYTLLDPMACDYRDLLEVLRHRDTEPEKALRALLAPEDQEAFFANPLPMWKAVALMGAYAEHGGLPSSGEAPASSPA